MSSELKDHLGSGATWTRGLFILLFALFYSIAEVLLGAIVLFQFASQLITGRTNDKLHDFSRGLTAYFYQLLQFFTYRSDVRPYPFSEWPGDGLDGVQQQESALQQSTVSEQNRQAETETRSDEPEAGADTTDPEAGSHEEEPPK